jgi:primary-amine oxidase
MHARDGTIQHEVKLTGTVMTGVAHGNKSRKYGTLLDGKTLYAPIHSHWFVARMHMAVDSDGLSGNSLVEVNIKTEPKGAHNPHANAFFAEETKLPSEMVARRHWDFAGSRYWRVVSDEKNRSGLGTAWRLAPGRTTPLYLRPEAMILRRAGFVNNHLWATPFNPYERFPGGDYPNQNPREGDGLPFWTQQNRSLEDQGIVLWYVFVCVFVCVCVHVCVCE